MNLKVKKNNIPYSLTHGKQIDQIRVKKEDQSSH